MSCEITVNHVHTFPPSPDLTAQLDRIETAMGKLADKVAELQTHVDAAETRDAANTQLLTDLKAQIGDLKAQLGDAADVPAAIASLTAMEGQIDSVEKENIPTSEPGPPPAPPATDPNAPPPAGSGSSPVP